MYILKKVLQPMILPPGFFILLLLIGGGWMVYRKRPACAVAFLSIAVIMYVMALPPIADRFLQGLERFHAIPENPRGDVIVMMGGAVYGAVPDMTGRGAPTPGSCERILTTVRLYQKLKLPIILTGGRVLDHHPLMGPIYKRMLVDLGIPEDDIYLENRSRDTFENAIYTSQLCRQRQWLRPIVITHAVHMPRTVFSFDLAGTTVVPFPCGFRTWPQKSYHWPDFLPHGYENLAVALHEYAGLLYYRWIMAPQTKPGMSSRHRVGLA